MHLKWINACNISKNIQQKKQRKSEGEAAEQKNGLVTQKVLFSFFFVSINTQ